MKKKILLVLMAVLLFVVAFAGCQSGIPRETYDRTLADLAEIQGKYADILSRYEALQQEKTQTETELATARSRITALENEVADLKARYELVGATPAETAIRIVRYYHETHVYSSYDLFVCSDMAAEVWNMLKAAGIDSLIAVGNIDRPVSDILQSNHAWVLAEIAPGQYLALEATAGYAVTTRENALYYQGWGFDSPAGLKAENDLRKEYNVRVDIVNDVIDEVNKAIDEYNRSRTPAEAEKYLAVYEKLMEIKAGQEAALEDLRVRINRLAMPIQFNP